MSVTLHQSERAQTVNPTAPSHRLVSDALDAVTEDRRASYLWDTRTASEAVGCVPNKFGDWWSRTERKLTALAAADPAATAAMLALVLAKAAIKDAAGTGGSRAQRPPHP